MIDLFADNQQLERLRMKDADVSILRNIELRAPYERVLYRLVESTPWAQREMNIYGKKVKQPRLTAWFGDPSRTYVYSGIRNVPLPWTEQLLFIKTIIEKVTEESFNSVLLNLYRSNEDSMGFHSDNEKELGPNPAIASLSFGAERTFIFKHAFDKNQENIRIKLASGTLLLMRGQTQKYWKHAINREEITSGNRLNLTFRKVYTKEELKGLTAAG